jgi:IS5 family transposase
MNFAQMVVDGQCPKNRFLEEMTQVVPWDLFSVELNRFILRKQGGRPPYDLLLLFKMHLLQVWFALSDEACEYMVRDRLSFRRFLGITIDATIPDATTLENFRHDFEPIAENVLSKLDGYFQEKGLLLKEGNMVDATFIQANSRPHKDRSKNSDLDAEHGHKGFGYSATVNADVKVKLLRKVVTTSARPHDSQMTENVLLGDEEIMYGDSAYLGKKKALQKRKCKARLIYKRSRGKKGEATPELPARKKLLNQAYSKVRSRVEHIFACWKTVFKVTRAWYRGLKRVNQQLQSLAIAYNLRRYGYLTREQCL